MISALIFDDEPAAANVLRLLIERHIPEINNLRIATKKEEALALLHHFKPQLVFQDIVMPDTNGFEFLAGLPAIPFEIIFTTAYNEYAIRAIRFSALDYLLKPIHAGELRAAVDRFLAKKNQLQQQTEALLKNLLTNLDQQSGPEFKLAVPTIKGAVFFSPAEIIRLEGEGNYTNFFLTNNRNYLSSKTLKEFEELLQDQDFLRIHKSHLVNRSFVDTYQNEGAVTLKDKTILPVSRQRKQQVAAALKNK